MRVIVRPRIIMLVSDGEMSIRKNLREKDAEVTHLLDIGHMAKSSVRKDNKVNKEKGNILEEFGLIPARFFRCLIRLRIETEAKVLGWKNLMNHFQGDHVNCQARVGAAPRPPLTLPGRAELVSVWTKFPKQTSWYFSMISPQCDGQFNESFNSIEARLASKSHAWKRFMDGSCLSRNSASQQPLCLFFRSPATAWHPAQQSQGEKRNALPSIEYRTSCVSSTASWTTAVENNFQKKCY